MKHLLLIIGGLFVITSSQAQCNDLFFSEYLEGSGNNKALEIYNPTDQPIDLSDYTLKRYRNGSTNDINTLQLQGTIQSYDVWVVANGQTDSVQLGGGNVSPPCSDSLQNMADQLDNSYPAPCYFNGDDALTIEKNNQIVDVFGKVGQDPGEAWTNDTSTNFTDANGGEWLTKEQTLIRHDTVESGVKSNPASFIVFAEYDTLPNQTWDDVGTHKCTCDPNYTSTSKAKDVAPTSLSIYPNPAEGDVVTVQSNSVISQLTIANLKGELVYKADRLGRTKNMIVPVGEWQGKIYLLSATLADGTSKTKKLVVR